MLDENKQRKILQKRVDLANEACGLEITLRGDNDHGFSVNLPEEHLGQETYGFAPNLSIALESFLEGIILGCSKDNPELQAKFDEMMEGD